MKRLRRYTRRRPGSLVACPGGHHRRSSIHAGTPALRRPRPASPALRPRLFPPAAYQGSGSPLCRSGSPGPTRLCKVVVPFRWWGDGFQDVWGEPVESSAADELAGLDAIVVPEKASAFMGPFCQFYKDRQVDLIEVPRRSHLESGAGFAHEVDALLYYCNAKNEKRGFDDRGHRTSEGLGKIRSVENQVLLARLITQPAQMGMADDNHPVIADTGTEVTKVSADLLLAPTDFGTDLLKIIRGTGIAFFTPPPPGALYTRPAH